MIYLGVDPGAVSGAWGIVGRDSAFVSCGTIPHQDGKILTHELKKDLLQAIDGRDCQIIIESVHAMPNQGVSSTFKFGRALGATETVLESIFRPLRYITPQIWKKALGSSYQKDSSLFLARDLWPDAPLHLKKHHNLAEALLLAEYLRRTEDGLR